VTAKGEQQENIFDLTARESAWLCEQHAVLLIKAFKAIAREELPARFEFYPPPTVLLIPLEVKEKWWLAQIKHAIFQLERNPRFFVWWFRRVMVDVGDYARWRKAASRTIPKPRPVLMNPKKVRAGIKAYLKSEVVAGRQSSQKRAWKWAQANMPGCRYAQVMEALVVEAGRRGRGRPQKFTPQ
jgi:hypothetical protein